MNTPTHIHHINFIVKDLEVQVKRYQDMLGLGEFEFEQLPKRGVATARILLGQTWLVLVSPLRADSLPGRYLQKNGEGFFLLSLGIKGLDAALKDYEAANSIITSSTARLSPASQLILAMMPFFSALSVFSIFMASTMASAWPS